jgi:mRNA interferase RelE/StbE
VNAEQVFYTRFDRDFFALPVAVRRKIAAGIDEVGEDLRGFPHYRLTGFNRYRLRVGDYRVIYTFDPELNEIQLLHVGHRREIYR